MKKNTFNSIKKKNLSTICHFLQYFILQSYSTHSPEFTGLNWENKFLFILSFLFCWIRNNNSESRSGSRQKFRIHADPDPQHWNFGNFLSLFNFLFSVLGIHMRPLLCRIFATQIFAVSWHGNLISALGERNFTDVIPQKITQKQACSRSLYVRVPILYINLQRKSS